jgi:hypothetical protein
LQSFHRWRHHKSQLSRLRPSKLLSFLKPSSRCFEQPLSVGKLSAASHIVNIFKPFPANVLSRAAQKRFRHHPSRHLNLMQQRLQLKYRFIRMGLRTLPNNAHHMMTTSCWC